jgi:hypothetical protein
LFFYITPQRKSKTKAKLFPITPLSYFTPCGIDEKSSAWYNKVPNKSELVFLVRVASAMRTFYIFYFSWAKIRPRSLL